MKSKINVPRKSRGRPQVDSERIVVRALRLDIDALDAYASEQADTPGRPEAIRRILRDWLKDKGYLSQ